jgi:hypothetical protein
VETGEEAVEGPMPPPKRKINNIILLNIEFNIDILYQERYIQ